MDPTDASLSDFDSRIRMWLRLGFTAPGEIWQREYEADTIKDVEDAIARIAAAEEPE